MMRPVMMASYDPWVGITEMSGTQEIHIYPNPANNTINLHTTEAPGTGAMVQCIDATGRMLYEEPYVVNGALETSTLSNGLYVFRVNDAEGRIIAMGRAVPTLTCRTRTCLGEEQSFTNTIALFVTGQSLLRLDNASSTVANTSRNRIQVPLKKATCL